MTLNISLTSDLHLKGMTSSDVCGCQDKLMILVPIYDSFLICIYCMKRSHLSCTANNAVRKVYVYLEMCMKPSLHTLSSTEALKISILSLWIWWLPLWMSPCQWQQNYKLSITSCKLCSQWKTCAVSDQLYVFQRKNPTKPSTVNKALLNAVEMNLWQIPLLLQTCHKKKRRNVCLVSRCTFSLKCDCEVRCRVNSFFFFVCVCVCLGLYS